MGLEGKFVACFSFFIFNFNVYIILAELLHFVIKTAKLLAVPAKLTVKDHPRIDTDDLQRL